MRLLPAKTMPPQEGLPVSVSGARASGTVRLRGLLVGGCCWIALGVASWLEPLPSGTGTHRQLHLPACSFLARTGWPCPSCGLTTSLAAMAHGRLGLAWKAHPFGMVLFAALVGLAGAGTVEAATGRNLLGRLARPGWWALACIGGLLAGWVVRLLVGWADGSLPMR
jgi:hypothetical protein